LIDEKQVVVELLAIEQVIQRALYERPDFTIFFKLVLLKKNFEIKPIFFFEFLLKGLTMYVLALSY
jgi:hypothetical protein